MTAITDEPTRQQPRRPQPLHLAVAYNRRRRQEARRETVQAWREVSAALNRGDADRQPHALPVDPVALNHIWTGAYYEAVEQLSTHQVVLPDDNRVIEVDAPPSTCSPQQQQVTPNTLRRALTVITGLTVAAAATTAILSAIAAKRLPPAA